MRALILSATALISLAAAPAFAHGQGGYHAQHTRGAVDPSCEGDRRTSRNVGGFLGALGGASAGRALAAAAVRPEGVILGTVVGAIVGSSLGSAAVDCSPRQVYTQGYGRSYGATHSNYGQPQSYQPPQVRYYNQGQNYSQAGAYQPPVQYQQPVYQQPAYQPPVYQQPVYQQPVYQQPVYQQPVYQQPAHQQHQVVAGEDWYQPSSQSYYGQERRGPLASAPPAFGRPDYVPTDSYVVQQQQQTQVVVTQTYQAGGPVYAPQQPMMVAPHGAPCGYYSCR
jgi:hypothetical protein